MIAASSLAFPGSKTLAAWWAQLASYKPLSLWVGHFFIHRLEVLAEVARVENVDVLHRMLLRALALEEDRRSEAGVVPLPVLRQRLDQVLHLGPDVIGRLLVALHSGGMLTGRGVLSEAGRSAAATGQSAKLAWERRELVFVERLRADGTRMLPPHFLGLTGGPWQRWQPDAAAGFEPAWLQQTSAQPQDWKRAYGFPSEIGRIADPQDQGPEQPPAWQRVAVDRPERLLVAMIAVGAAVPEKILVFTAQQDGWELKGDKAIGSLSISGRQEFPDLAAAPNWQRAWQDWCHTRQIPPTEAQACTMSQTNHQLEVQVPAALHTRLTAAKSDLLKGDTWLLAGDGYVRSAANVRIQVVR